MANSGSATAATTSDPQDRWNLIYVIFYWLGMGSLLPWNFFIAVNGYWMHKFRNVTHDSNIFNDSGNDGTANFSKNLDKEEKLSPLQLEWNSHLAIASMIPNVTFLLFNAAFGHRFPTMPRLVFSQAVMIPCLVFTCAMAVVDTDDWQGDFFWVTIGSVVVINVMVAIFQGGLSGVAAKFPPRYMGAVVQGQGLGGIFASAVNVVTLTVPGADFETAAFACFLVTIIFISLAVVALLALTRTEFFLHYYHSRHCAPPVVGPPSSTPEAEGDRLIPEGSRGGGNGSGDPSTAGSAVGLAGDGVAPDSAEMGTKVLLPERINVLRIGLRIWVWIVAAFINFLVCLAVFPAITALVVSQAGEGLWAKVFFIPVGCFLLFNLGDYTGRLLASSIQWPRADAAGARLCLGAACARFAFLPLFLLCNASPANRHYTPVLFPYDAVYLVLMILFSVSTGYIGTICMMFAPKVLPEGEAQATAASIMVTFLVLGLAFGSLISHGCVMLL